MAIFIFHPQENFPDFKCRYIYRGHLKPLNSTRWKGAPDARENTKEVYYMERKAFLYTFAFIYNFTNPGEMNKQTKILQVDKQDLKKNLFLQ